MAALGDLDGDGYPDLAVGSAQSGGAVFIVFLKPSSPALVNATYREIALGAGVGAHASAFYDYFGTPLAVLRRNGTLGRSLNGTLGIAAGAGLWRQPDSTAAVYVEAGMKCAQAETQRESALAPGA